MLCIGCPNIEKSFLIFKQILENLFIDNIHGTILLFSILVGYENL